jgi:hypothetical protein
MFRPLAALAVLALLAAGCGSGDRASKIAQETGASACTRTSVGLKNRLDGTKTPIYDCTIDGASKCVVEEGGIARDVTATVRILFADTLSGTRPACL